MYSQELKSSTQLLLMLLMFPGSSSTSPRSYLASGDFSAVPGGIQAASRSHVAARKPDVPSGALYIHHEEPKSGSCCQTYQLLGSQMRFLGLWLAFPGVIK
jgi:hypothetical protein